MEVLQLVNQPNTNLKRLNDWVFSIRKQRNVESKLGAWAITCIT
jgi:hypothetical protein